jgi:trypsin
MPLTREHATVTLRSVLHLLSRPNIHTIDVLPKTVGGEETDELAIVVTVTKKKRPHQLDDDDYPIPNPIEASAVGAGGRLASELVPTDVIEGRPKRLASLNQKVRPTIGGYMITILEPKEDVPGTLGVNREYDGKLSIVTNNHVIANNGNVGLDVYQPSPAFVTWGNKVATVTGFLPVKTYANPEQSDPECNKYDFAWANVIEKTSAALTIKDIIGEPTGTRAPKFREHVRWIGYTTGTVQEATIKSTATVLKPEFSQARWAWFENVIDLGGAVSDKPAGKVRVGDSGAAIVADDMNIVGLVTWNDDDTLAGYGSRFPPH